MERNKLAVILVGAPGSGKGTQGELLSDHTGWSRYVMSDMIKQEIHDNHELYDKVINQGELLGDKEVFRIFREHFANEQEVVLDGIPRTLDQAYWLHGFLERHKYKVRVVYLQVDEDKLLNRILERGRKDDNPDVFKERLSLFDEVKNMILDVYSDEIIEVDGDQQIEGVKQEMLEKLEV